VAWSEMLPPLPLEASYIPDKSRHEAYLEQRRTFRKIYLQLAELTR